MLGRVSSVEVSVRDPSYALSRIECPAILSPLGSIYLTITYQFNIVPRFLLLEMKYLGVWGFGHVLFGVLEPRCGSLLHRLLQSQSGSDKNSTNFSFPISAHLSSALPLLLHLFSAMRISQAHPTHMLRCSAVLGHYAVQEHPI